MDGRLGSVNSHNQQEERKKKNIVNRVESEGSVVPAAMIPDSVRRWSEDGQASGFDRRLADVHMPISTPAGTLIGSMSAPQILGQVGTTFVSGKPKYVLVFGVCAVVCRRRPLSEILERRRSSGKKTHFDRRHLIKKV